MGDLMTIKFEEMVQREFDLLGKVNAKTIGQVASKLNKSLPSENEFLEIIEHFFSIDRYGFFSVATLWIKKNPYIIKQKNMEFFEHLLYTYIDSWGKVDQFCYRCLNPMIELSSDNHKYLLKWSNSQNKDVRRASLVSMIKSHGKLTLDYDYKRMIELVEKLKADDDFHVTKAVGWVLKCAYVKYPERIEQYLRKNVKNLNRIIFRYALEHIKEPLRNELIQLDYRS